MTDHEPPNDPAENHLQENAPHISAADARGAEIILRSRRRRLIFFGTWIGGTFVLALVLLAVYRALSA